LSNKKPTIVCDQDIPHLADWLSRCCQVVPYQAGSLSSKELAVADGLVVRSVTPVTARLLSHSPCRWIGSATAGVNHLEIPALVSAGVDWAYAPGANAPAVCEYVLSALFVAHEQGHLSLQAKIAVVGVGQVGSRVAAACEQRGFQVVAYDPPREQREPSFSSASLSDVLGCNFVVVCASYTQSGSFPSHDLLGAELLSRWVNLNGLINAARGEVVDYEALFSMKSKPWVCLDVWHNEPTIDSAWVSRADMATPHIAGYSYESKWRLSAAVYRACCQYFGLNGEELKEAYSTESNSPWADTVGLESVSKTMKEAIAKECTAAAFHTLRKNYPLRHEG
jgi:erythronate-4-phosphate dehydrogenase